MKHHILALRLNKEKKYYHIQQCDQENYKQSITINNDRSRTNYAISCKDSAQCAVTTSFLRVNFVLDDKHTRIKFIKTKKDRNSIEKSTKRLRDIVEKFDYKTHSDSKVRHKSGKYTDRKSQTTYIHNLKQYQVNNYSEKMLTNLLLLEIVNDKKVINRIYDYTVKNCYNLSEMFSYIRSEYYFSTDTRSEYA